MAASRYVAPRTTSTSRNGSPPRNQPHALHIAKTSATKMASTAAMTAGTVQGAARPIAAHTSVTGVFQNRYASAAAVTAQASARPSLPRIFGVLFQGPGLVT